jgi:HEAT repeat protein
VRLADPSAEDTALLDSVLKKLVANAEPDPGARAAAAIEVDRTLLPAILVRINSEAERADRGKLKQLLLDTRDTARDELKRASRGKPDAEIDTPDYLPMMLAHPAPDNPAWQPLVRILALSRMCGHIGTVEAVRVLIQIYVRFEFLRVDTQLQMNALGDKALAGLIEATRHPAPSVSEWAKRRLDFLGKAIPSEVVQVQDPQVVADVLRAYGRVRDPDALRLIISFANSERSQIREAARQSITLLGEVANWPLRDSYEDMVGKKPPREWTWDRTARELFRNFDQIRFSELYEHYKNGLEALANGNLDAMRDAFDKVLARKPTFEPRDRITQGYFAFVEDRIDKDPTMVLPVLQHLTRIAESEEERKRAGSLLLTLQARALAEANVADQFTLSQALDLDPNNARAKRLLDDVRSEPFNETTGFMRVLWPTLLGGISVLAAAVLLLRRRFTAHRH